MTAAQIERRAVGALALAAPRRLAGVAMHFGEIANVAGVGLERFAPGALSWTPEVALNWEHDPERMLAWQGMIDLEGSQTELRMLAELPPVPLAARALAAAASGRLGLSVEFTATSERRMSGVRVIEAASLSGLAATMNPAYNGTIGVEARNRAPVARRRVWL